MLARIGQTLSRISQRIVPDPFVLALLLTLVVSIVGAVNLTAGSADPGDGVFSTLVTGWIGGFSLGGGLAFALQMCLVLLTGHALALSPPVQRGLDWLAKIPKSTGGATLVVAAVACLAAVIHWGLGAIAGALVAREMARSAQQRGLKLHYPLLGGAAYAGLVVWHGGLSGSAPLKVAEKGHFLESSFGVIPVSDTIFSVENLIVTGALIVVVPLIFWAMAPKDDADIVPPDPERLRDLPEFAGSGAAGVVGWLQDGRSFGTGIGLLGLGAVLWFLTAGPGTLDINSVNLLFLFLGLSCQGTVHRYVEAIADGASGVGAIVLQFPFYFGILGIMKATGLITLVSEQIAQLATAETFPIIAFVLAGIVNFFVPSGGGQWAVQGQILGDAGTGLGVSPEAIVLAFSYGDAWTNMLQPFWALPLLGIMGLRARDIIGYAALVFLVVGVLVPVLLVLVW